MGVLYADARLNEGIKGFANLEAEYNAADNESNFYAKELFLDYNINSAVYFRTGKQVLQWGRCYLWNPTDLVNVEPKSFLESLDSREGAYGLKTHVPFGTKYNIYSFVDAGKVKGLNDVACAMKFEWLIDETEMAVSGWGRDDRHPVFGYDISTRLFKWDIAGEASLSKGSNLKKIKVENGLLTTTDDDSVIPKFCVDFGRTFDWKDQLDKFRLNMEFFYNGDGYSENYFSSGKLYQYDKTISYYAPNGKTYNLPGGDKKTYLIARNLYQQNYYSKYYAALFTTVNKFFISDLSLSSNVISNIAQKSFIFSNGLTYKNINDFTAGLTLTTYLGPENTEYTFFEKGMDVMLTAGISF